MLACLPSRLRLPHGAACKAGCCLPLPRSFSPSRPHKERPRRAAPFPPQALPEPFDSLFSTAVVASSALAIIVTLAAPLTSSPKQQQLQDSSAEGLNFEWAVAAVVSCIPLVNSIAWLMPAISTSTSSTSTSSRAKLYLLYSMLYSAPLLRSGFDFDTYSLLMLGLCIAHVQAERIASTEPELLLGLPAVPGLVQRLVSSGIGSKAAGTGNSRLGSGEAEPWGDVVRGEKADVQVEDGGAGQELKEFDRMLLEREKRRRAAKLP